MNMISTFCGIGVVCFGWLLFGLVICGLGAVCLRWTRIESRPRMTVSFWVGFAVLIAVLQIVNLFVAINLPVVLVLVAGGLAGFSSSYPNIGESVATFWSRSPPVKRIVIVLALIWIADKSLEVPTLIDSNFYHFQSIRWANEYKLPPGLGNLHGRLAFNQSYFLYVAFLNALPVPGLGHNLANGLLLGVVLLTIIDVCSQVSVRRRPLIALMIPVSLLCAVTGERHNLPGLGSPAPDVALYLLELVLFAFLVKADEKRSQSMMVAVLSFFPLLLAMKFSAIGFVFGVGIVALLRLPNRSLERKSWIFIAGLGVVLIGGWIARSVVASGYLLYPVVQTGVPVDWKVPAHLTVIEANWIKSWARQPFMHWSRVLGSSSWVPKWIKMNTRRADMMFPLVLFLVTMILPLLQRSQIQKMRLGQWSLMIFALIFAAVCWFLIAPDPRFAGAVFWLLVLSGCGMLFDVWPEALWHTGRQAALIVVWGGFFVGLYVCPRPWIWVRGGGLTEPIVNPEMFQVQTDSGLTVWLPKREENVGEWELPSASYYRPQLRLRGKDLGEGFYLDESNSIAPDFR